ncbi:MAG TPA: 6-phosphogluconolactonase [Cellulomonas sp.]|uniref:6-phosphogluconolactonase n=1 Tax=Cellulomonas sp. TaxID=40001 RepID=UPI002E366D05|nr:6-phosphogluconolactonase [Cellulomonas sp.]HEX5331858.1 6-phosphogluconolactonase [Cellulomonas sp.]
MTAAPTPGPVRRVVVHPDAPTLVAATAARLLTRLLDAQLTHSPVHLALTGGTVGIATLAAVASHPARDAIDWSGVHVWWSDERFLPTGDPERNETQARDALLDALGGALPPANVHPMPAPGSAPAISTPEESAAAYADELVRFAPAGSSVPPFDVLMLGMGPDGHVASLFPGHAALTVTGVSTVGVHGSPKPPPERVSLTFDAINAAHEVWLVVSGAEKAMPVASALAGDPVDRTPAAGAQGRELTLWLLDADAAAGSTD